MTPFRNPRTSPVQRPALRLLPLCLAIAGAVRAEEPAPQTWTLCRAPNTLEPFRFDLPHDDQRAQSPTDVVADHYDLGTSDVTVAEGDAQLQRGDQWLAADKLTYQHKDEHFVTEGLVRYQDRNLRLTANKAEGDQKTDTTRLEDIRYQFNKTLGNGVAASATMHGDIGQLEQATYSACPPGERQWEFSAAHIKVDQAKATGTAQNATLKLGGVPVLWFPYVSFPTDDRRRSGVLTPTIGSNSRNGLDLQIPYYLNLAPNYDATLTARFLSKRGLMLDGEFRYLGDSVHGVFQGTWLPSDNVSHRDRSLLHWDQFNAINPNWYASVNFNHVSDNHYFSDFGDSLNSTSISLLQSQAGLYGRGRYWTASLSAELWQTANPLLAPGSEPFRRLPQARFGWDQPLQPWMEFGIDAEAVNFDHDSRAGGRRIDLKPFLRFPFGNAAWYVTPEIAWRYTGYNLDSGAAPGTDQSPSRSLPILSLDAGATFERSLTWRDQPLVQTLEPRLFYLRVPYRDQNDLPIFDTQALSFGWSSLFRDNRYGGADRQADANQATLAVTTRLLNANNGAELLSASLGRITYFDAPRVQLPGEVVSNDGSDWVADVSLHLSDNWNVGVTQQWDPDRSRTTLSALHSQWQFTNGGVLNLGYRYRLGSVEQTDLSFQIPVNTHWNILGRWNYSLRDNQTLEALIGFEWKSCCVAVRLLGRQYIRSFDSRENFALYLEIQLNGLGSFGRDTGRLLDNAILGYRQ